ncbi:MAG TPA: type II toxin-antitoxin system prevent-host-death family antitoxin [Terriglobales bacterium]|jgi:prevent-host-death family protein
MQTTIHKAKTNLSKLIEKACSGEEVVIARGDTPVVKLVPIRAAGKKRVSGRLKGLLKIGPEYFEPLPPEELEGWE